MHPICFAQREPSHSVPERDRVLAEAADRDERFVLMSAYRGTPMLTYHYALMSDPCERTVKTLIDYLRAHPGCLHSLDPEDSRATQRAIAAASSDYEHEFATEAEAFMLGLDQPVLH